MLVIFFLNIKHLYFLFSSKNNNNNNNKTISKFKIFLKSRFFYTRDERCKSFVSRNENNAIVAKDSKT